VWNNRTFLGEINDHSKCGKFCVGGWGDGEMRGWGDGGKIISLTISSPHFPTSPSPYLFRLLPFF